MSLFVLQTPHGSVSPPGLQLGLRVRGQAELSWGQVRSCKAGHGVTLYVRGFSGKHELCTVSVAWACRIGNHRDHWVGILNPKPRPFAKRPELAYVLQHSLVPTHTNQYLYYNGVNRSHMGVGTPAEVQTTRSPVAERLSLTCRSPRVLAACLSCSRRNRPISVSCFSRILSSSSAGWQGSVEHTVSCCRGRRVSLRYWR